MSEYGLAGPSLLTLEIDTYNVVSEVLSKVPALISKIMLEIELVIARRISIRRFLRQHALLYPVPQSQIRH